MHDAQIIQGYEPLRLSFFGFLLPLLGAIGGAIGGGAAAVGGGIWSGLGAIGGGLGALGSSAAAKGVATGIGLAQGGLGLGQQLQGMASQPQQPYPTSYSPQYFQQQSMGGGAAPQLGSSMDAMQLMAQLRSRSGGGMGMY